MDYLPYLVLDIWNQWRWKSGFYVLAWCYGWVHKGVIKTETEHSYHLMTNEVQHCWQSVKQQRKGRSIKGSRSEKDPIRNMLWGALVDYSGSVSYLAVGDDNWDVCCVVLYCFRGVVNTKTLFKDGKVCSLTSSYWGTQVCRFSSCRLKDYES